MKQTLLSWTGTLSILLAAVCWSGCGGGGGGGEVGYEGTWRGTTSRGGTVSFQVEGDWVTSFRVEDGEASIWIQQPILLEGDTFEAHNSENGSAPNTPGASVTGLFGSETECSGNYTLYQSSRQWSGTFTAVKQ